MQIRPATPEDARAIHAFWAPMVRDTMVTFASTPRNVDQIAQMIAARPVFVSCTPDVTGFATYSQFRGSDGYARTMEHTVIVAPEARGSGAGRALMSAIEDHARTAGVYSLWAGVSSGNPDGIAFHESVGYTPVATLPEVGYKFDQWWDLVLMKKRL